ncbi:MAG TPA: ABC transporter substrate-binding protein [Acetobacteraceae bacterium]|nr:ABC transporter substrate-binding protein [Acetobacteraceae bacterium]
MPSPVSRRDALKIGAAAAALPLVHIRSGRAAGKLSLAFWDHWVPDGDKVMQKQVETWAAKNQVEVSVDFITSNSNKLLMTGVAEAQAKTGHDMFTFLNWEVFNRRDDLAPVDDVMDALIKQYGEVDGSAAYLAKPKDHWIAVPTSSGSQVKGPCARISWMKAHGFDPVAAYPVKPENTALADQWNYDLLMKLAEEAKKDGMTFALGCGGPANTDGTDQIGASFTAFGGKLIDRDNKIQLEAPEMQQALEWWAKYVKFMPEDAQSYDDASNNRALISGKSALIFNPPSAWAVARRDAPDVAKDCWTFSSPVGPKGRILPAQFWFWGVWKFSKNQSAAKDVIAYLSQREQVEERDGKVLGYDIPPFLSMRDFKVWEEVEPPKGTVYNYPIRPWHHAQSNLAASEAAPEVAVQIYQNGLHNGMIARLKEGQSVKQVTAWAKDQIEGFLT